MRRRGKKNEMIACWRHVIKLMPIVAWGRSSAGAKVCNWKYIVPEEGRMKSGRADCLLVGGEEI